MQAHIYPPADADTDSQKPVNMPDLTTDTGNTGNTGRTTIAGRSQSGGSTVLTLVSAPEVRIKRARRLHLALLAARTVADGVLLVVAFALAYWLRYSLNLGPDLAVPESYRPFSDFYPYVAAFTVMTLITFEARGLYALPRGASWFEQMRLVVSCALIGVSALTLGALLFNPVLPSRLAFIYLWFATVALFGIERFVYRSVRVALWRRGINIRKALVVGAGPAGQRIMKDILERPELGYKLAGYVSDSVETPGSPGWLIPLRKRNGGLHHVGTLKDVERVICQQDLHEVIVALPATHHAQILSIIDNCRTCGVDFKLVPDLFEMRFNEVRIDALNGVPLIGVKDLALQGFNLFIKRVLDVALSAGVLIVAAIPMLVIALVIKANTSGPVLFKQLRVGKGGRLFTCYKFRSMYKDAEERLEELRHLNEADGPIFKIKDDPRLTPVGRILRQTSLDELPQLFNIVNGEMSWVGPRPPTPAEVEEYSDWHRKRLEVTPGLTGLWQVSGRSDLSFDEMVKLDLYYAENWSLAVDMMIILRTIPAVVKREGAY